MRKNAVKTLEQIESELREYKETVSLAEAQLALNTVKLHKLQSSVVNLKKVHTNEDKQPNWCKRLETAWAECLLLCGKTEYKQCLGCAYDGLQKDCECKRNPLLEDHYSPLLKDNYYNTETKEK